MSSLQSEAAEVITLVTDSRTNIYAQLASLVVVLYDYALTFDDELAFVWKKNWSIGSTLFVVNRYTGIFSLCFNASIYLNNTFSDNFCFHWVRYQVGGTIMAFWLVEIILAFRVWALWGRSMKVLLFFVVLFTATITTIAVLAGEVFRFITVLHRPGPFASGCYPLGFPKYTYALAIPEVTNSGILLGMTLYRTVRTVKHGRRNAPLLVLFIKDGVLYYFCILFILLMNAFAFGFFAITAAASGLAIAIPCAFGSRILLNMRRQILNPQHGLAGTTLPTIQFGGNMADTLANGILSQAPGIDSSMDSAEGVSARESYNTAVESTQESPITTTELA